jgi:hypothetical protein
MLRYFEYFLNREPVALDEVSLPRSVLEGLPEHLPLADWPVEQRPHLAARAVREQLAQGYRVVVALSEDRTESLMWWFVPLTCRRP